MVYCFTLEGEGPEEGLTYGVVCTDDAHAEQRARDMLERHPRHWGVRVELDRRLVRHVKRPNVELI